MQTLTVTPNEAGQRMDKLLAKYLDQAGKGFLYKMMRKKNITLNGKKCDGSEHLEEGRPYLLCGTHWATEWVGLEPLARRLEEGARSHGGSLAVQVSRIVTDPWVLRLSTGSDRA